MAAIVDSFKGDAKLLCVMDHDGNVLLGKRPEPDPPTLTATQQRQAVEAWAAKRAAMEDRNGNVQNR